jgi:ankyrin repeat protein
LRDKGFFVLFVFLILVSQDDNGNPPLFYALSNGAVNLCKALVQNGALLGIPNAEGLVFS